MLRLHLKPFRNIIGSCFQFGLQLTCFGIEIDLLKFLFSKSGIYASDHDIRLVPARINQLNANPFFIALKIILSFVNNLISFQFEIHSAVIAPFTILRPNHVCRNIIISAVLLIHAVMNLEEFELIIHEIKERISPHHHSSRNILAII